MNDIITKSDLKGNIFPWLIYNNVVVQFCRKILLPTLFLKVILNHCGMKETHAYEELFKL